MKCDIALRVFTEGKPKTGYLNKSHSNRVFVFDTETTSDEYQNLKIGSFAVYVDGVLNNMGLFYNSDHLNDSELEIIKKYASKNGELNIYNLPDFVKNVFYQEVYYKKALCIGFNLPFDISRLAISFNPARRSMKGGFSFKLINESKYPRIRIKHIHSKLNFIRFSSGFDFSGRKHNFNGNFIDLRGLVFSFTNEDMNLKNACQKFNTKRQKTEGEHGLITEKYIDYNINDTFATYQLYINLVKEYNKYNLSKSITDIYSPASIGKACLEELNIKPFSIQNPNFPKHILGYIMTTYYGGRSEVKIRKQPTKVVLMDFLSMYPTVCVLQNLWQFIIADKIQFFDDTENTKKFIQNVTLEDLKNKEFWNKLSVIVEIIPKDDILPVRCKYEGKNAFNIGINYLTYNKPIFYTLADVIASKLLTGKTPEIIRAIRFKSIGIQKDLKSADIAGFKIDPKQNDFFQKLIEERQHNKEKEHILKIIANATSYGIFIEINKENKKSNVDAYGLEKYRVSVDKIEKFGQYHNPIIAVFITSAARLILACTEAILSSYGAHHAFCDTDSMAVPKENYKEIQDFFENLNPYNFNTDLFKLEEENFDSNGKLKTLWFYGISTKRYVLYNIENGKINIRKHSSHGLGHILNPFGDGVKQWEKNLWLDILLEHYGKITKNQIYSKYSSMYAISKITISTTNLLKKFSKLNKQNLQNKQIKPFNFILVGFGMILNKLKTDTIKPITSFKNNPQEAVYDKFIDYTTGDVLNGLEHWKPMNIVFDDYIDHKEAKSEGEKGVLRRKHIQCTGIAYIGKETNKLELSGVLEKPEYVKYMNSGSFIIKLLQMTPKEAKRYGIARNTLWYMKRRAKKDKLRLSKKMKIALSKAMEVNYVSTS